ncbi:RhoGAP domain-containing protein [Cavenderia fasciculata]|uniref:RhoGAP domain-containing protein n=1 Tax=Cavenderia fasciculata TaxID=261658 RepID=F4PSE6_CACFS|nr:RhoGAP domain-containing protein [Cavenderia fasciculata]EGG21476.1 RhoGAP domain-containing protein [Cavenderia fasciculata]|eukprot:XP_004359326.1 RhoGAP domain-containing protein [Cavenderia fasciculata]
MSKRFNLQKEFEISSPSSFQHVQHIGAVLTNTNQQQQLQQINNNSNNNNTNQTDLSPPPRKASILGPAPQYTPPLPPPSSSSFKRNNNINPIPTTTFAAADISTTMSSPRSIQQQQQAKEHQILHTPPQRPVRLNQQQQRELQNAKTNAKATIISSKLKRFFTHRPSRDSLYERHILTAPNVNLSFVNIFKIITAIKKANAIKTEGLFRVNGNADTIRALWQALNDPENVISFDTNHHDLAGLLKLYLREARFPLIPIELFPNGTTPTRVDDIKDFVTKLPNENIKILQYIIEFLEQVASNSSVNKMAPMAIGVCFAPNMVRSISSDPAQQTTDSLTQIQNHCSMITAMIENKQTIFGATTSPSTLSPSTTSDELVPDRGGDSTTTSPSTSSTSSTALPPPPPLLFVPPPALPSFPSSKSITDFKSYPLPPPLYQSATNQSVEDLQAILSGAERDEEWENSALYEELTNLLIEDISSGNKDYITNRLTNLFLTDPDNFKAFLRETLGVEGLISLLELVLTLE